MENMIPSLFQLLKATMFLVGPWSTFKPALAFSHHVTGILTPLPPFPTCKDPCDDMGAPQIIQDPLPSRGPWMATLTFPFPCNLTFTGSTDIRGWPLFCPPPWKYKMF